MNRTKNARTGIYTMLVSITRRLPGTKRISERLSTGMTTLVLAAVVLLVAAGSASALTEIDTLPFTASTADETYYLDGDLTCAAGVNAITVTANGVTIDGKDNKITGTIPYGPGDTGVYAFAIDDLTVKNLEIEQFGMGINIEASWDGPAKICNSWSNRPIVDNCQVHDCGLSTVGSTHGIQFLCAPDGEITDCEVHDIAGHVYDSCDCGGAGIRLYGKASRNLVDNNELYNCDLAGFYTKAGCQDLVVTNNVARDNGVVLPLAEYTGGLRFQCKSTHRSTIECNTVTDSIGPGIFIGSDDCVLRNNTVTGSKTAVLYVNEGHGLFADRGAGGANDPLFYDNVFCDNEGIDMNIEYAVLNPVGDRNTCYTSNNYNDNGMATGCDYACIMSCDAAGNVKEQFAVGDTVYAKGGGYGLLIGAAYDLWIHADPVTDGDPLVPAGDPSGARETVNPAADANGVPCFGVTSIWVNNQAPFDEWDIIADKLADGVDTGKYNRASDGIDSGTMCERSMPGFAVPEVATFTLCGLGLIGLVGYIRTRKD